jgi:hypothetical protein
MWDATLYLAPSESAAAVTARAPGLSFVPDDIRHWEPESVPHAEYGERIRAALPAAAVRHRVPGSAARPR